MLNQLFCRTLNDFSFLRDENTRCEFAQKLATKANFVICKKNEEIIGYIAMYINNPPLCYITMVSVVPEHKRKGISQLMLMYMEQKAMEAGCTFIKLEVKKANTPAIKAYQKYGFIRTEDASNESFYMEKIISKV